MENLWLSTEGTNLITTEGLANLILQQNNSEEAKFSVKDSFPENIRILDWTSLKDSKEKFKTGRIPGARFLDLNNKFIDPDGKYPTTFPPEHIVRKRLGQLGIKRENEIILYSQTDAIRFATRAWYIFKSYGFTKVAVLNGGLLSWNASNFPIESGEEPNEIETENDDLLDDCTSHLIDYSTVKEIEEKTEENTIIDARSQGQYEGRDKPEMEGIPSGHIPNAVNIPSTTLLAENGAFKKIEELQEIFKNANVDKSKRIISHWNNGNSATVVLMALNECGYTNIKLFDGSWSEYGSNL